MVRTSSCITFCIQGDGDGAVAAGVVLVLECIRISFQMWWRRSTTLASHALSLSLDHWSSCAHRHQGSSSSLSLSLAGTLGVGRPMASVLGLGEDESRERLRLMLAGSVGNMLESLTALAGGPGSQIHGRGGASDSNLLRVQYERLLSPPCRGGEPGVGSTTRSCHSVTSITAVRFAAGRTTKDSLWAGQHVLGGFPCGSSLSHIFFGRSTASGLS